MSGNSGSSFVLTPSEAGKRPNVVYTCPAGKKIDVQWISISDQLHKRAATFDPHQQLEDSITKTRRRKKWPRSEARARKKRVQ
jgi:2-polyprenyl-6-methoxyphenol hydroxylase-like FAD-dependent oxidoreductase